MTNVANQSDDRKGNWAAIQRNILNHDLFSDEPYTEREAWIWLILNAAWKTHRTRVRAHVVQLERGQVLVASTTLEKEWQWGRKRVRNFLKLCSNEKMIKMGQQGAGGPNVATICNYDKYQVELQPKGQGKGQNGASKGPAKGHTEEDNKTNKDNIDDVVTRENQNKKVDFEELENQLRTAAGESLNRESASLLQVGDVLGWVEAGADLERDILPAIRAAAKGRSGIASWSYFAQPVAQAVKRRKAGLPAVSETQTTDRPGRASAVAALARQKKELIDDRV